MSTAFAAFLPDDVRPARPDDEPALIQRSKEDPAAFAVLYVRYSPRIYAYLRSKTPTVDEAADLTQYVFERALAKIGSYRERGMFAAWLFRIARNVSVDHERSRRPVMLELSSAEQVAGPWGDPYQSAVRAEDLRRLRALVSALSDADRELLALRFAAGLKGREIANLVGRSESAVRKQLWRALRQLKQRYQEDGHV